ncbi:MAG: histidine kinase dimerization/phospho-acceptor domain-containing protein, partial [Spirochaetota bacterium]
MKAEIPGLHELLAYFKGEGVHTCLLYGSAAAGRLRSGSDIDLAIAAETELTPETLSRYYLQASSLLQREVDLRDLRRAKEEAERASQAKSEFLSTMSHELRTPMNAVLGFAQLLETDPELGTMQAENVREILKGGRHLLDLINEVLDLASVESGRVELSIEDIPLGEL